jgi:hypothetical protein
MNDNNTMETIIRKSHGIVFPPLAQNGYELVPFYKADLNAHFVYAPLRSFK